MTPSPDRPLQRPHNDIKNEERREWLRIDDRLLLECARLLRAHVETVKVAEPSGAERHDTETMRRIKGSVVEAEQLLAGTR